MLSRLPTRRWTILRVSDLRFRYAAQAPWLLNGIDLALAPGEILGVAGPSGTGKTTLAKLLAGYLKPTSGEVLLDDRKLPTHGYCPVTMLRCSDG